MNSGSTGSAGHIMGSLAHGSAVAGSWCGDLQSAGGRHSGAEVLVVGLMGCDRQGPGARWEDKYSAEVVQDGEWSVVLDQERAVAEVVQWIAVMAAPGGSVPQGGPCRPAKATLAE